MQSFSSFSSGSSSNANCGASPARLFGMAKSIMSRAKQQQDWCAAAELLLQAATKGHVQACYALSDCHKEGLGVAVNSKKMQFWKSVADFYAAEEAKPIEAKHAVPSGAVELPQEQSSVSCLGDDVANGNSVQNHEGAAREIGSSQVDDLPQIASLRKIFSSGSLYSDQRVHKLQAIYLQKAQQGFAEAQYLMGLFNMNMSWPYKKHAEAMNWFELAAAQGHVEAIVALAQYCDKSSWNYRFNFRYFVAAAPHSLDAAYNLGCCYMYARGTARDLEKARNLFEKAAKKGHSQSRAILQELYFSLASSLDGSWSYAENHKMVEKYYLLAAVKGHGSAKAKLFDYKTTQAKLLLQKSTKLEDLCAAIKLYQQACELDADLGGKKLVSACLEYARSLSGDFESHDNWRLVETCYKTAMQYGSKEAVNLLALSYMEAAKYYAACEFDDQTGKAFDSYLKASEIGAKDAHVKLADCYLQGKGVEKNLAKAISYYQLAAKHNDKHALASLAKIFSHRKEWDKAFTYVEQSASNGCADAILQLARCYYYGRGVSCNYARAFDHYYNACKCGINAELLEHSTEVSAQAALGMKHLLQAAFGNNATLAVENLQAAAELGDDFAINMLPSAYYELAASYQGGLHDNTFHAKACEYFRKAAELGHEYAMLELGDYLECGIDVEQDLEQAQLWYTKAGQMGNKDAREKLRKLGVCLAAK